MIQRRGVFFERKSDKRKVLVNAAVGSIAGVSPSTVARYKYVKQHADEKTLVDLREGNLVPFGKKRKKKKLSVDGLYKEIRSKEKNDSQSRVSKSNHLKNNLKDLSIQQSKKTQEKVEPRGNLPTDVISTRIITHPIADLSKHVDPGSVDVIITEPPCKEEDIDLFDQLGDFARHALKEGAPCVVISGNAFLPDFIELLRAHLDYCWTLSFSAAQGVYEVLSTNIETRWKPILVFSKGAPNLKPFSDCTDSLASIVESFSYVGETICDPFCGEGFIGKICLDQKRSFVGSDIDVEKTLALKEILQPRKA